MSTREKTRAAATWLGVIPLITGAFWLLGPAGDGPVGFALSIVPGALLLIGGVGEFLLPQDLRAPRLAAVGGVLGSLLAVPAVFSAGGTVGTLLLAGSAASFVSVGFRALAKEPERDEVPSVPLTLSLASAAALDEAILAGQPIVEPPLPAAERVRSSQEVDSAVALFRTRGWLERPALYHAEPPPLPEVELEPARRRGRVYEQLRFDSGYEPANDEPGRERWLGYVANRTAHARVLRCPEPGRPWLLCIHGSRAGTPADLDLFGVLHSELGLNLVLPVLPLHGPRRSGRGSGAGFVNRWELDFVHAMAQSVWDLRRLLSWLRAEHAAPVGAYGVSLGGYVAALLASLDGELVCAIAGIAASDFARLDRRAATPLRHALAGSVEPSWADVEALYRPVSPLSLQPQLSRERLCLFAATADRLLPSDQVRDLWRHWDRPRLEWCPGGHLSVLLTAPVRRLLAEFLGETLLASCGHSEVALETDK